MHWIHFLGIVWNQFYHAYCACLYVKLSEQNHGFNIGAQDVPTKTALQGQRHHIPMELNFYELWGIAVSQYTFCSMVYQGEIWSLLIHYFVFKIQSDLSWNRDLVHPCCEVEALHFSFSFLMRRLIELPGFFRKWSSRLRVVFVWN